MIWGDDRFLRLWTGGGKLLGQMEHAREIVDAALLESGEMVLSWEGRKYGGPVQGETYVAKLWKADGELLGEMAHEAPVEGAAFDFDDNSVITWTDNGIVRIWRPFEYSVKLSRNSSENDGVEFSTDGGLILLWSGYEVVRLLDSRGRLLREIKHSGTIAGAQFIGQKVMSWSTAGQVAIWNQEGVLASMQHPKPRLTRDGVVLSPRSDQLLTWSSEEAVLWSSRGQRLAELLHEHSLNGAAFSPDGQNIATWDAKGVVKLWTDVGHLVKTIVHDNYSVAHVEFSPDGGLLLVNSFGAGDSQGKVRLWRLDGTMKADLLHEVPPLNAKFISDQGKILTWQTDDSPARLWSGDGQLLAELSHGKGAWVVGAAASQNGQRLITWASGTYNYSPSEIRLWDGQGGLLATLPHETRIYQAVFDGAGEYIVSTTEGGQVSVWDKMGNLLAKTNREAASALILNSSKYILVSSASGVDLITYDGQHVMEIPNAGRVAAVSEDESTMLTSSWDGVWLRYTPRGIAAWLRSAPIYRLDGQGIE